MKNDPFELRPPYLGRATGSEHVPIKLSLGFNHLEIPCILTGSRCFQQIGIRRKS